MAELADIAVVGGGAAGLATAIFAARRNADRRIVILDGTRKLGAKILVSGGGRCNVTNSVVQPADFWGGSRNVVRRVLGALPVPATVEFFREIGVSLHQEENGKLFPDSNSARTVVEALLRECGRLRIDIRAGFRVQSIERVGEGFRLPVGGGDFSSRKVVLATGGRSLPKTGSDGGGYALAQALGHSLVAQTPALAPLVLDGAFHVGLSGTAHEAEVCVRVADGKAERLRGSLLWTHFGVSGPVVLNASRHWHRAALDGRAVQVTLSFLPGDDFEMADRRLIDLAARQPTRQVGNALAALLPTRVADAILAELKIDARIPMAHFGREPRRRLVRAMLEWPLPVRDSRGYGYAEVTAGGVPLDEIDSATMESRRCPGLHLVGEILDVDGRIGGFNFQWAWASGFVAAAAL